MVYPTHPGQIDERQQPGHMSSGSSPGSVHTFKKEFQTRFKPPGLGPGV